MDPPPLPLLSSSSPPSPHYDPAVSVSALALHNLSSIPYLRLRLHPTPSPHSPIADRAKWLDPGVGSQTALHAAALAHLEHLAPSALAISLPSSSPSSSSAPTTHHHHHHHHHHQQQQQQQQQHQQPVSSLPAPPPPVPPPPRPPIVSKRHHHHHVQHPQNQQLPHHVHQYNHFHHVNHHQQTPLAAPSAPAAATATTAVASSPAAPSPPILWVFAPPATLPAVRACLTPLFAVLDDAVWTPANASAPATAALLAAFRRALTLALSSAHALRVADLVIHPRAKLSYSLDLTLAPAPSSCLLVRVAIRPSSARSLTDADTSAAVNAPPNTPLQPVIAAPHGLRGVLAPRPIAGDALAAAVLKRWREAALLPAACTDDAVVFVRLPDGVEVPFPRAMVLAQESVNPATNAPAHLDIAGGIAGNSTIAIGAHAAVAIDPSGGCGGGGGGAAGAQDHLNNSSASVPPPPPPISYVTPSHDFKSSVATPPSRKPWRPGSVGLWRGRKRPRSPAHAADTGAGGDSLSTTTRLGSLSGIAQTSAGTDHRYGNQHLQQNPGSLTVDKFAGQAPTADSLSAAISAAPEPAPPVLSHPLAEPLHVPQFHEVSDDDNNNPDANVTNPSDVIAPVDPLNQGQTPANPSAAKDPGPTVGAAAVANGVPGGPALVIPQPPALQGVPAAAGLQQAIGTGLPPTPGLPLTPGLPPTPGISQQLGIFGRGSRPDASNGNGLDAFLMGNPNDSTGPFESSGGMDMADFNTFEDDVTDFFRDGMDDRLSSVDGTLLQPPAPPTHVLPEQPIVQQVLPTPAVPDVTPSNLQPEITQPPNSLGNDISVPSSFPTNPSSAPENAQPNRPVTDVRMDVDSDGRATNPLFDPAKLRSAESVAEVIGVTLSTLRATQPPPTRAPRETVESTLASFFEADLTARRSARLRITRPLNKRRIRANSQWKRILVRRAKQPDAPIAVASARGAYVPRRFVKRFYKLRRRGSVPSLEPPSSDDESSDSDNDESSSTLQTDKKPVQPSKFELELADAARAGPTNSTSTPTMEYDPVKIADSVAVDCASACIVLAAERAASAPPIATATDSSSRGSMEGNVSPDTKAPLPAPPKPQMAVSMHAPGTKVHSSGLTGSPLSRVKKRDRESNSLLALLEMHAFAGRELELFPDSDQMGLFDNSEEFLETDSHCETVSSAIVRRVLLGLPRILETSPNLRACFDAFKNKDDASGSIPKIKGPTSISTFLGDGASVFPLSPPRVCVGYDKEWLETHSGALPLWEKAGLEPYSEPKNVEYVALGPKDIEEDVRLFLRDVSAQYEECSFGRHTELPSDSVTLIANAVPSSRSPSNPAIYTDNDKKMVEQYQLAVTGLCTKLAAVAKERRKNPTDSPTNVVAYIVSPFERRFAIANVALLQAIAPLATMGPSNISATHGLSLPVAPWRESQASKGVVSIIVRVIVRDVVDRHLQGPTQMRHQLDRPPRPQLMKAVCFAVYSSIRYKRVRSPPVDSEVATVLSRGTSGPDDLLSPMTPELHYDVQAMPSGTPLSPMGVPAVEDTSAGYTALQNAHGGRHVDQSSALSPSLLHEPAVVLAGVGSHMGQTEGRANMAIHLAYAYCDISSRIAFAWTDQRGEMLDTGTVQVARGNLSASRRRAFWGIWIRGQRWRMSFVKETHATVSKLGSLCNEEIDDWEWVAGKVLPLASGEKKVGGMTGEKRIIRRFPPVPTREGGGSSGGEEGYTDLPTPATPGAAVMTATATSTGGGGTSSGATSAGTGGTFGGGGGIFGVSGGGIGGGKSGVASADVKMGAMSSLTILSIRSAKTRMLMEKGGDAGEADRRDFAIVCDTSVCKDGFGWWTCSSSCSSQGSGASGGSGGSSSGSKTKQTIAKAVLGRFMGEDGIGAVELNMVRHYGAGVSEEDEEDEDEEEVGVEVEMENEVERSDWDGYDMGTIGQCITVNFDQLRYLATPPSWPVQRWASVFPVHVEAVRSLRAAVRNVHRFGAMTATAAMAPTTSASASTSASATSMAAGAGAAAGGNQICASLSSTMR